MRKALRFDGWEDHLKLPNDWKTKLVKSGNRATCSKRVFLTESGDQLGDLKTAVKFLEMSEKHDEDDVQNLLVCRKSILKITRFV